MAKEKPGVMLYWKTFDALEELVDGEAKEMFRAIRHYAQFGETPDFSNSPTCRMAWIFLREQLDADNERFERQRDQHSEAGKASANKRNQRTLTDVDER